VLPAQQGSQHFVYIADAYIRDYTEITCMIFDKNIRKIRGDAAPKIEDFPTMNRYRLIRVAIARWKTESWMRQSVTDERRVGHIPQRPARF
jgi:hypothetical protein